MKPVHLRLENPGLLCKSRNWAFRNQHVAKKHPYTDGLPLGVLWDNYYDQVMPEFCFSEIQLPDEIIAASITAPYVDFNSDEVHNYLSGISMGIYNYGKGKLVLNTFHILDQLGKNPAADRLLLNML